MAPTGAREVTMSVCLSVQHKVINLHLSSSEGYLETNQRSIRLTVSYRWILKYVVLFLNECLQILSVSENLPTTAYVKMIDLWLIFILLKPFVDIILQIYIETIQTRKQDGGNGKWVEEHTKQ